MKIELKQIPISEIANGYFDNNEDGVVGYGGKLNIRPPYQREFVYNDKQRDAVIHTIMRGFPLNVMYWAKNEDGSYEVLDGQQRTISFCQFVNKGGSSINLHGDNIPFSLLTDKEQEQIMNYKVMVYICEGNDKERLDWFRTINIAGAALTEQELLNINYTGEWLSHAKRLFSKTGCYAVKMQGNFMLTNGTPIRQEVLETALSWIAGGKDKIASYMAEHQHDSNANELKDYFSKVIEWVKATFPKYYSEMKGLDWGRLYRMYSNNTYDIEYIQKRVEDLRLDEEVSNNKNIYEYVLSGEENKSLLSLRQFTPKEREKMWKMQGGFCPISKEKCDIKDMDAHHIDAWENHGKTELSNGVMLSKTAHKKLHAECTHKPFEIRELRDKLIEDVKNEQK